MAVPKTPFGGSFVPLRTPGPHIAAGLFWNAFDGAAPATPYSHSSAQQDFNLDSPRDGRTTVIGGSLDAYPSYPGNSYPSYPGNSYPRTPEVFLPSLSPVRMPPAGRCASSEGSPVPVWTTVTDEEENLQQSALIEKNITITNKELEDIGVVDIKHEIEKIGENADYIQSTMCYSWSEDTGTSDVPLSPMRLFEEPVRMPTSFRALPRRADPTAPPPPFLFETETMADVNMSLSNSSFVLPLRPDAGYSVDQHGHQFQTVSWTNVGFCSCCTNIFRGLFRQGVCCIVCGYICHVQCVASLGSHIACPVAPLAIQARREQASLQGTGLLIECGVMILVKKVWKHVAFFISDYVISFHEPSVAAAKRIKGKEPFLDWGDAQPMTGAYLVLAIKESGMEVGPCDLLHVSNGTVKILLYSISFPFFFLFICYISLLCYFIFL